MAEYIPDTLLSGRAFSSWELTIRDSFDLKALYVRIHDFLVDEEFVDMHTGKDNFEVYYYEKDNGNGTNDHKMWWRATRFAKNSAQENIKFYITIDFTTVMMGKKEIIHNANKVTVDSGELKINFNLFLDFANNKSHKTDFDNHPILKYFKNYFWNRVNKKPSSLAKGEAMAFSNDLYTLIQTFTGVRPQSGPRDFIPEKGIGN